jgi:hypothetical protein
MAHSSEALLNYGTVGEVRDSPTLHKPSHRMTSAWLNDHFLTRLQMAVFMPLHNMSCTESLLLLHVAFQIKWIRHLDLCRSKHSYSTKSARTKINSACHASGALSSLTYFKGQPHYFHISLPASRGRCQEIAYLLPASVRTAVQQIHDHVNALKESRVLCIFAKQPVPKRNTTVKTTGQYHSTMNSPNGEIRHG